MGTVSVGERNKMLDAYVGRTGYTANAAVYAKLHLGDPGAAGTSNPATETTRQQVTFGNAASSSSIASTADTEWTNVSTTETYTHVSFWDASSGGTFLGSDDLSASAAMTAGQTFRIPSGSLSVSLSGDIAAGEHNKMLDAWAGRTTYSAQAGYFVKLHTGDPGGAGANNAAGETTRKAPTFGNAASAGSIANTANLDWTSYPSTETVAWVSTWTASTAGTWLGNDQLPSGIAMTGSVGDIFRIATGAIVITLT